MSNLGPAAREELDAAGITPAAWARVHFTDGRWHGDVCGCPDDRCTGRHHDHDEPCRCLTALINDRPNGADL